MSTRLNRTAARPLAAIMLAALLLISLPAHADRLSEVKTRGKLIVGVKKDVPQRGYLDPSTGVISGMEVDLAQSLADSLGVKLEIVGLRSDERIAALQSARVDVLVATLADTPDRREQVTMVMPYYYSSGVNLLARRDENFHAWTEVKNRKICSRRGSFFNRPVTVGYGADIVAFHSLDWAIRALRDGRCSALIYDETTVLALLQKPEWSQSFVMPMPTIFPTPWSVAIARTEKGGALEKQVSSAIVAWHRQGDLVRLESKWKIPATDFPRRMNALWTRKNADGTWHCGSEIGPATPPECLGQIAASRQGSGARK